MSTDTPRIYVACLAAYNNAKLHGKWIDANQSAELIQDEIDDMLKASPEPGAEEWAIHDFENFMGVNIGEFSNIQDVANIADFLTDKGEAGAAWLKYERRDISELRDLVRQFEDEYRGDWRSLEEYAEQLLEDTGALSEIPGNLRYYFDFEKFARDMEFNGEVWTIDNPSGGVFVFGI